MTFTIKYSTSAKNDIRQSVDYINNVIQNPFAGYRLNSEVQTTVRNLKNFPCKHPLIDDILLSPYQIRFLKIKNYLLFYTVIEETKTIYIIRFLYSRSDWKRILKHYVQYDDYLTENTGGYVHEEIEEYGKQFKKKHNNMQKNRDVNIDNDNFDEEKARQELYDEIKKGLDDIAAGRTVPAEEVFAKLRKELEN